MPKPRVQSRSPVDHFDHFLISQEVTGTYAVQIFKGWDNAWRVIHKDYQPPGMLSDGKGFYKLNRLRCIDCHRTLDLIGE